MNWLFLLAPVKRMTDPPDRDRQFLKDVKKIYHFEFELL
jgi:hypothetical protein